MSLCARENRNNRSVVEDLENVNGVGSEGLALADMCAVVAIFTGWQYALEIPSHLSKVT